MDFNATLNGNVFEVTNWEGETPDFIVDLFQIWVNVQAPDDTVLTNATHDLQNQNWTLKRVVDAHAGTIEEGQRMLDFTDLAAAVAEDRTVNESAITLINGLADKVAATAGDPAAVEALAAELRANSQALADKVAENTVAAAEPPGTT